MELFRNDPEFKKDFLIAKTQNENQVKYHDLKTAKDTD